MPPTKAAHILDFSETVVPITEVKPRIRPTLGLYPKIGLQAAFGTGFCLDPACRFIATNYHVAVADRPRKIKGDKIIQRYLDTPSKNDGATVHVVPGAGAVIYAVNRDLAIFELRKPLPHHHGLAFSLDDLEVGQEVDICAYPLEGFNPFRKLRRILGTFQGRTATGMLLFDYKLPGDKAIAGGASGGIVVNKADKIVGILADVGYSSNPVAIAVPIQSLAEFVGKVQPLLAGKIFPLGKEVMFVSDDIYPKLVPARADALQHRPEEPYEVSVLRKKAQHLADSMRNFIAVQTLAWGSGDKEPAAEAAYEVRVIDGEQRFRSFPEGKKELNRVPFPPLSDWALDTDEWSALPKMVGTEYRLKVQEAPDVMVSGRRIKVFQYYSSVEDDLCPFQPIVDFGFFKISRLVAVACYGEVWTDGDTNIIRISENLDLSKKLRAYRGWKDYQIVVTYGWLKRANEPPRLIPLTTFTQGRNGKRIYWCSGQFKEYRVFSVRTKLLTN